MSQTILKNEKVIAVGNFDGVHLGHVKVLKAAVALAKELNCIAAAMTFNPHPRDFFAGKGSVEKITDEITKTELILQCGIRDHIIEAFNWGFAEMDAEKFADYLKNKFNCCAIVCGANFRFGKKAAYGTEELKKACEKFQMKALICNYEEGFSSTRIRNLLTEGDVTGAEKLLGRPFSLHGKVLHGRHIGTGIGFPTVNISAEKGQVLPKFGVYATRVTCGEEIFKGITNVGSAPTVSENNSNVRTETFLLNTNKDLYDMEIKVEFLKFIRAEKKFNSIEELKIQIEKDLSEID